MSCRIAARLRFRQSSQRSCDPPCSPTTHPLARFALIHSWPLSRYDAGMQSSMRILAGVVATVICVSAGWWSRLPVAADDPQKAEEEIHRAPGANEAVTRRCRSGLKAARLQIAVVDAVSQQHTFCRINVVGGDGMYYEPGTRIHSLRGVCIDWGIGSAKDRFDITDGSSIRAAHARSMFFPERCASKSGKGSNTRLSLKRLKSPLARLSP